MFEDLRLGRLDQGRLLQDPVLELTGFLNCMRAAGQVVDQASLLRSADELVQSNAVFLPDGFTAAELVLAVNSMQVLPGQDARLL